MNSLGQFSIMTDLLSSLQLDSFMTVYKDRKDAGRLLAIALKQFSDQADTLILGIPRGGVVVAKEIADTLHLPLVLVPIKKIGHPLNQECAIGAISEKDVFLTDTFGVSQEYLSDTIAEKRNLIRQQIAVFGIQNQEVEWQNKTILIVDDGIATGTTIRFVIALLKKWKVNRIVLAVPVCSFHAYQLLKDKTDAFFALEIPRNFHAVGDYYHQFDEIENEEIALLLKGTSKKSLQKELFH
jgi:predicted phosphoribosyltransferase